jgi:hypothetical protein
MNTVTVVEREGDWQKHHGGEKNQKQSKNVDN